MSFKCACLASLSRCFRCGRPRLTQLAGRVPRCPESVLLLLVRPLPHAGDISYKLWTAHRRLGRGGEAENALVSQGSGKPARGLLAQPGEFFRTFIVALIGLDVVFCQLSRVDFNGLDRR